MRTQEHWEKYHYPKILMEFSPRLQKDIKGYPIKDLPEYGSYYIWGPAGSGKTTMAAHMYIEARKKHYFEKIQGTSMFVPCNVFFEKLRVITRGDPYHYTDVLNTFRLSQYLVLDDLGSTRFTDWETSQIQVLINYRYEYLLTTVITSNHSLDQLGDAMGDDRVPSRIKRMSNEIIELG